MLDIDEELMCSFKVSRLYVLHLLSWVERMLIGGLPSILDFKAGRETEADFWKAIGQRKRSLSLIFQWSFVFHSPVIIAWLIQYRLMKSCSSRLVHQWIPILNHRCNV